MIVEGRELGPTQLNGRGAAVDGDEDDDGITGALVGSGQHAQVLPIKEGMRVGPWVPLEDKSGGVDAFLEVAIAGIGGPEGSLPLGARAQAPLAEEQSG